LLLLLLLAGSVDCSRGSLKGFTPLLEEMIKTRDCFAVGRDLVAKLLQDGEHAG